MPKREEVEWDPPKLKALLDGAEERRQQPAQPDDLQRIAARAAQLRRDAGESDLSDGYHMAESVAPGTPPKYQVLRDDGHDEQLIGVRDSREEAMGLAQLDHNRIRAEQATAAARHTPTPPPPRR